MVFGNLGGDSGTGVLFTRDPLNGSPEPFGDWLPGGQGEDVVAGTHDPLPLAAFHAQLSDAHDELIRDNPTYAEIVQSQIGEKSAA